MEQTGPVPRRGVLARLVRDQAGNTLALVAAAVVPLLALVGGGIDMSRGYLSQSRLQQACDAGVLAARKKLGSSIVVEGDVPGEVAIIGDRFFNLNFRDGSYGSEDRTFAMALEDDYSISGLATVNVPTTIMRIFGNENIAIKVECEAQLNFSNLDVMMVLDVTGSMAQTNPGDSASRIDVLKQTVLDFHAQLEGAKAPGIRIRYGFVPYSTNVNVGALLDDSWVVDEWAYQSRDRIVIGTEQSTRTYERSWAYVSGAKTENVVHSTYPATWHPGTPGGGTYVDENENVVVDPGTSGYYTCDTAPSPGDYTSTDVLVSTSTEPFAGPPVGTRTIQDRKRTRNGTSYWISRSGTTCRILKSTFQNYVETYQRVTDPTEKETTRWRYRQFPKDVRNWRTESNGCIEERATYAITDFSNVDFSRALDLDIDLVPGGDDDTRWAPMYPDLIYARSMKWNGSGSFTPAEKITNDDYVHPASMGLAGCPAAARKLGEMDGAALAGYLATLSPTGQTYHDIGMIWGGRLISPTGLFASENRDLKGKPTSRNLIFLTDGETAPLDLAYSSYGLEPLDSRRWNESSPLSLTQVVERRFAVACDEVKKRNVNVWIIGFGTTMTDLLKTCAGSGHWFQADDANELKTAFDTIAKSLGDLRIAK